MVIMVLGGIKELNLNFSNMGTHISILEAVVIAGLVLFVYVFIKTWMEKDEK